MQESGDDVRNTIWNLYVPRENPGEFELLNALCHMPTIRLYYGNSLNFKDHLVQEACRNLMIDAFTEPALIEYTDSSKIDFKDYINPQRLTKANLKVFLFEQLRFK